MLGRRIQRQTRDSGEEEASLMHAMAVTYIHQRPLTTSELAKWRRVSLQSASVLVQGLVERGWVVRAPDPNDRRQSLLQVTPEGLAYAEAKHDQLVRYLAGVLDALTPEQLAAGQIFLPALFHLLIDHTSGATDENTPSSREEHPIHDPIG